MKATSKEILEAISRHCANQTVLYRFNTGTLKISDKYREGRLTALEYISELTYYYLQEEKRLKEHFHTQLRRQMELHSCLEENAYKQGLYDALNEILTLQKEIENNQEETKKKCTLKNMP